jgi:hypothetical protein
MLQPWDKRTWLIVNVILEEADDFDLEEMGVSDVDISTYDGFLKLLKTEGVDEDSFKIDAIVYKGWLVKLGGERFFTWELRGVPNDETEPVTLEPGLWYDFRVDLVEDDRITMRLIDPTFEPLDGAPKTRRAWEKVIRKHVDDEALYGDETIEFRRLQEEDLELVTMLFFEAFIDE